ncbi:hypothetical protein TrVE_jg223 [Triparma verrucosa]|uniref:Uncharacterized protein n=2 Tax=Triparma verrucosa TaxID=1606542 RepID=A0A9W7F0W7_9STRA|nr:hypothetical protein TrVE_jg223 [Triparma verrucosa]
MTSASVIYSRAKGPVNINPKTLVDSLNTLTSNRHGVAVIRQNEEILKWHSKRGKEEGKLTYDSPAALELSSQLCSIVRSVDPGRSLGEHRLMSVIHRDTTTATASTATTTLTATKATIAESEDHGTFSGTASDVHRDLDEHAVSNLRSKGEVGWYNIWMPLKPITDDPLGFVSPATVNVEVESTGFMGIGSGVTDRTGLVYSDLHEWYFAQDMKVGDVLIWRSEVVYHAAIRGLGDGKGRRSVDFRLAFRDVDDTVPE